MGQRWRYEGGISLKNGDKPIPSPYVLLREEFDDWAVLFDSDTGHGFGLSPAGVYLWKLLDGKHTMDDLLKEIRSYADDVPEEAGDHIRAFIDGLTREGLIGFQSTESGPLTDGQRRARYREKCSSPEGRSEAKSCTYEPPKVIDFTGRRQARGTCPHGSYGGDCTPGGNASGCCASTGACGAPLSGSCCGGACGDPTISGSCCGGTCGDPTTSGYCCGGSCGNEDTCHYGGSVSCNCQSGCSATHQDAYSCWCGPCPGYQGCQPGS